MAKTPSNMLPLGTSAPDFTLLNAVSGTQTSLSDVKGEVATLVMFICNHCPFVKHLETELGKLSDYLSQGIGIVAISSNDIDNYPEDAPDKMKLFAEQNGFKFPYLYDASQDVAKAYDAACTPDFYIFDKNLHCVYRGRFDASTPGSDIPVSGDELRAALDACLAGSPISDEQNPSIGCNIKWK